MVEQRPKSSQLRRTVIESGAVVLSILLAFSIDAWWDRYQQRERERVLLHGILADYRASRPNLAERLELAARMARNTSLLMNLVSIEDETERIPVPDSLLLGVMGGPTYEPATNTLDAALGSGEIELIRNDTIRAELAHWRRTLIDTTEDEIEVRRITNEQLLPLLARATNLAPYFPQVLNWSSANPVTGLPGSVVLRPSRELASILAMRHFYTQFAADDLGALLLSLDRLIMLLESELELD